MDNTATEERKLKNRAEAARFLESLGYKVKKSKIYDDFKKGLLRINPDKTINETEVRAYAEQNLDRVKSDDGRLDRMTYQQKMQDLKISRLKAEKLQFDIDRERGRYLLRDEVLTQFAIKWSAIEAVVKHLVQTRAIDWIYAVGGDGKKRDLFVELVHAELDDLLNQLATIDDLKISLNQN